MSDFNTDKFLSLMARVARLEEEITYNDRDDRIEELFKTVHEINSAMAANNAMIQSSLKTAITILGITFTLISGFWMFHGQQTDEIEREIIKNNRVMHSADK